MRLKDVFIMKVKFAIYLSLIVFSSQILVSCGHEEKPKVAQLAQGGVEYGGVFRINEVGDVRSLYPLNILRSLVIALQTKCMKAW
jgi:hypothetical protein